MIYIDENAIYNPSIKTFTVDGVNFSREFIGMFSREGVESMRGFSFTLEWEDNIFGGIAKVKKTAIDIPLEV